MCVCTPFFFSPASPNFSFHLSIRCNIVIYVLEYKPSFIVVNFLIKQVIIYIFFATR